jgi:hypothetical protein
VTAMPLLPGEQEILDVLVGDAVSALDFDLLWDDEYFMTSHAL